MDMGKKRSFDDVKIMMETSHPAQELENKTLKKKLPNVEAYQEILLKNIDEIITQAFPTLRSVVDSDEWHELVYEFITQHEPKGPSFLHIPEEFVIFLQKRAARTGDSLFVVELAHYEWVVLSTEMTCDQAATDGLRDDGDLLNEIPVVSPLAQVLSYKYPVHEINSEHTPAHAPEKRTYLVVCRNPQGEVSSMTLNHITAQLILALEKGKLSGKEALEAAFQSVNNKAPSVDNMEKGEQILNWLKGQNIILGSHQGEITCQK
jgi:hypothetical protein